MLWKKIIKYDERIFKELFFEYLSDEEKYAPISDIVLQAVKNQSLVKREETQSFADRIVQILCFVFEIYYQPSYDFIIRHKLLDNLFGYLLEYCPDKEQAQFVCDYINDYLKSKSL